MNDYTAPLRASLKLHARQTIKRRALPCLAASGVMLALQMLALYVEVSSGGVLGYYFFQTADYANPTGIALVDGGLIATLRFDQAGVLFALPLSYHQLVSFFIIHIVIFILTAPLLLGILEYYHAILQDRIRSFSAIFRWYSDLRLTGRAVGLELVLGLVKWAARVAGALPGLALFIWATGHQELDEPAVSVFVFLAFLLILAGMAVSYLIYTFFLPAQYLLACSPITSVSHALSSGIKIYRGRRWNYFLFRLSFLLWYLIVDATYGIMGLIVLPYSELANLLYLQAADPSRTDFPVHAQ